MSCRDKIISDSYNLPMTNSVSSSQSNSKQILNVLSKYFGHTEFRGEQQTVIETILAGQSCLVLMPTGMGKSLCYQLPAMMLDGITLVLSPLIALMQDQVEKAQRQGIAATYLSSTLTKEERELRQKQISEGQFKLVYVTPERMRKEAFREIISKQKISLLAVDEAHCISQWGHDFRPDYSRLGEFRQFLQNPVTIALTATATVSVQKDILQQLGLGEAPVFSAGIERPNLQIQVHEVYGIEEKIRGLIGLRHQVPGPGIVYFSLIQTLYQVSSQLARLGVRHLIYHGQLSAQDRQKNLRLFVKSGDDTPLILATPAFGLGIDKNNVRLLVHMEIPSSVESYYQEIGRAGRDGQPSFCHLFYDPDDVTIQMEFIKWANPDPSFITQVYHLIDRGGPGLADEGVDYLRAQLNFYNKRDFRVETALNLLERCGCLEADTKNRLGFSSVREPSIEDLKQASYEMRLKMQNQKLLEMVRLATLSERSPEVQSLDYLQEIYHYFGR